VLVVTEQAADEIKAILEDNEAAAGAGLRIVGVGDGDDTELEFGVADGPEDGDTVVTQSGASVFLDAVAANALSDRVLDVEAHGDHVHFSLDEQEPAV
jgi:iron-sulfur cluster assembly protein